MTELEEFLVKLKENRKARNTEAVQAEERGNENMNTYITGRRDELDLIIGVGYEILFNNTKQQK